MRSRGRSACRRAARAVSRLRRLRIAHERAARRSGIGVKRAPKTSWASARGVSEKWRAPLCSRRRRGVPWTNSATERAISGIKIRRKTVKGLQDRRRDAERVWADAVGLGRSGRLGVVGAGRGVTSRPPPGGASSENPPQNDQPFLGRLRKSAAVDSAAVVP